MHFVTVYFDGEGPNREDRYSILLPCVWKESGLPDTIFRKLMDNYGRSCFDIDEVFDEIEGDPSENPHCFAGRRRSGKGQIEDSPLYPEHGVSFGMALRLR